MAPKKSYIVLGDLIDYENQSSILITKDHRLKKPPNNIKKKISNIFNKYLQSTKEGFNIFEWEEVRKSSWSRARPTEWRYSDQRQL